MPVLMFHRVQPEGLISKPNAYLDFGTLISQEYLEQIIQRFLQAGFSLVTFSEICLQPDNPKLIALTFDDGYEDNFTYAYPILKKYNVTATFFVLTQPCREGTVLPLDIYYQCVDEANLSAQERDRYIRGDIKKHFYWMDPQVQLAEVIALFGSLPSSCRVSYMRPEQIQRLAAEGFEIGSHGVTHALLTAPYMTIERGRRELRESKAWLEGLIGKPILSYCFPSGAYTATWVREAAEAGYKGVALIQKRSEELLPIPALERIFVHPASWTELEKFISVCG